MIPELPADCWLMRAHDYVRQRSMLPDWVSFWTLMAYCGAALQDHVYVAWSGKPVFPNLPLLLVLPSGTGKTSTMNTIRPIFRNCLPRTIPEDSTAESAIRILSSQCMSRFSNSVALWEVPELADVFGRKDYQQGMIARITRLLDAPKDREISRATGNVQFQIRGHAVLNWIAGTTFEWLQSHVEDAVSSGGFLPRLLIIYTNEDPKWIPDPQRDEATENALNQELYAIISGVASPTQRIISLDEKWTSVSRQCYEDLLKLRKDSSSGPFVARRQENILRIYMILNTLTTSYDTLTTSTRCAQFLENQAFRLSQDLLFTTNRLFEKVLGYVVSHPKGASFAAVCRGIRGATARAIGECLEDLVKRGLVEWNPRGYGETGMVRPIVAVEGHNG